MKQKKALTGLSDRLYSVAVQMFGSKGETIRQTALECGAATLTKGLKKDQRERTPAGHSLLCPRRRNLLSRSSYI